MQTYHVSVVYEDGASVTHAGLIQEHAQAIFDHATIVPQTVYAHVGPWIETTQWGLPSLRWQRLNHYLRPEELDG